MAANEIIPSTFTTSPSPIVFSYTSGGDQLRDGNHTETGWSSNSGDQWLRADLGSSKYVDYVCILPWHSGAWSQGNLNDANCYLEHSNDGASWTVHSQITGVEAYTYRRISVAITARYWRIHSTTGYGACGDFRFFDTDPALDTDEVTATFKCLGKVAYGGGAAGPCFRDGVYNDVGSVWASDNTEASCVADLGVAKMVKTIKIAPGTAGSWSGISNAADGLTLDYSSDGSSWTTFATISGTAAGSYTSYSPNISARYWRLHTFGTYKSVGDFRFYVESANTYTLSADAGTIAITGSAAALRVSRKLSAAGGSLTLAGSVAGLRASRRLPAAAGAVALTGGPASLKFSRRLAAGVGSLSIAGSPATLRVARRLAAGAGSIALTGADVNFSIQGQLVLSAEAGAIALTGGAANLRLSRRLGASGGAISLSGASASLRLSRRLDAQAGAVALTGSAAALRVARRLHASGGVIVLTGGEVVFRLDENIDLTVRADRLLGGTARTRIMAGTARVRIITGATRARIIGAA